MKKHLDSIMNARQLTFFLNEIFEIRAKKDGKMHWEISLNEVEEILKNPGKFYRTFSIDKKSGGKREISSPTVNLKAIQWSLASVFEGLFIPSKYAFGFIKARSIAGNAREHIGQDFILNVDIKGFFPSISAGRLSAIFRSGEPAMSEYGAKSLARLCTLRGKLPQGSPASPVLTNLVSLRLDSRLIGLAGRFGCRFSRYVDDITFSGSSAEALEKLLPILQEIVKVEGFELNPIKTRMQSPSMRQEVTGLVISNAKSGIKPLIAVNRRYRRQTRAMLHTWSVEGRDAAATKAGMTGDDVAERFVLHVRGRMAFMLHVNRSPEVTKLHKELKSLIKRDQE